MFLHIGNSRIVFYKDIIGIFDLKLMNNPINKQFLESARIKDFYRHLKQKKHKSFIVTSSEVLLSPLVPSTLARRKSVALNLPE
ncbi:MAG: DUF370 domain-containing protein [Firmicutes bacterium]|jgi:regulator of extracellular matrix RemA (YlzA/DUF370 family)|nr:DUF370 domain-containing protein [Bacillota bacterium]HPU00546.1 DUF370 domain-containing protein [Bacillota bacterium]